ncbi:MAG: stage II sporulation protein E [Deltaproteobacteria bacterium HGW-Deltaproteobacteria-23]|nr:MAG: stage II sporulation protein E [Deltaproteobacteria bacterium HGW-Deltaproteobacteria-23]
MITIQTIIITITLYILLNFIVAGYAYARYKSGRSIVSNSFVYALSITVYCTSWTYYGSVGRAATSGIDFIAIYLGPSLTAFSWWFILRKIIRVSKENNITSIADFISSRYGKSQLLGAIITIISVMGIIPYIALQLKAVSTTFAIICSHSSFQSSDQLKDSFFMNNPGLIFAVFISIFGIIFGARTVATQKRHEGLVAAIAFESVVKLLAFLCVGVYVTYFLFNGVTDIFMQMKANHPELFSNLTTLGGLNNTSYANWSTNLILAMSSIMLLPRQFQIMVIENSDENHIKEAMWRFPAYLFAINIFVIPIAFAGILLSGSNSGADFFVLTIPMNNGHHWLALLAFLGGFSAAAGMVIAESVATSTMILNHLIMPLLLRLKIRNSFAALLLALKRISIFAVVFLGYVYFKIIGDTFMLVNIGLISFSAVTQLAPSLLGAIYWKRGNTAGATAGIIGGFIIWFYTLLLPSFVKSGWIESDMLEKGLFGIALLKPTELFGLTGLDMWSNSLFWSMLFNVGGYLLFSILLDKSERETEQCRKFTEPFSSENREDTWETKRLSKQVTIIEFVNLMKNFIGEKQANEAISEYLEEHEIYEKGMVSEFELPSLKRFVEKTIAGSVGSAAANAIVESYLSDVGSQMESFYDAFRSVRSSLEESREALYVRLKSSEIMNRTSDLDSIVKELLALLVNEFKFDLVAIRVIEKDSSLHLLSAQSSSPGTYQLINRIFPADDHFIAEMLTSRRPQFANDTVNLSQRSNCAATPVDTFAAFAHIPLVGDEEPLGVLSVYSSSIVGLFTEELINLLSSLAGQLALAMKLIDEREARDLEKNAKDAALLKNAAVLHEMEIAKQIQLSLLPEAPPDMAGIKIASLSISADHVGGDYYDFFLTDNRVIDAVIADVSGHNVGAALIMVETRTVLRAQVNISSTPADILSNLNNLLMSDLSRAGLFISMFYIKYDSETQWLTYSNAGHNQPLLYQHAEGKCRLLDAEGMILGVKENVLFENRHIKLSSGDILLLYTDGVTEAAGDDDEMFGSERLGDILIETSNASVQSIIDHIYQEVISFSGGKPQNDDVSMVALKIE